MGYEKEEILHYCWKHKMLPDNHLQTTDGCTVEVLDPGLYNRNAGPDFFNAKIKIDGQLWVGNVEIHDCSSDWYAHGHDSDANYDNVILHVARVVDREVTNRQHAAIPQLQLDAPEKVKQHYRELIEADQYPPCYKVIPQLPTLVVHSWTDALQAERLEQKTNAIMQRLEQCQGDWDWAYFVTIARNLGFGVNGDAFEQWALSFPLRCADHHRDDLLQIEALFMGQAGLLRPEAIQQRHREKALADPYYQRLASEYAFLANKFKLKPIDHQLWKFLRMRPQNFPTIRISQLVHLYHQHRTGLSALVSLDSLPKVRQWMTTQATDYWQTHYIFGAESEHNTKQLSAASVDLLIINTVVPMLFAYGRYHMDDALCDRAFELLEKLKPEKNHIVDVWKGCGLDVKTAGDSQALIQLKKEYCDKRDCLRCRIGYEYLTRA